MQQQQAVVPGGGGGMPSPSDDAQLFQTPADLVCPITLSLYQEPVCNALGQVYERTALQRHLLQAAVSGQPPTDPVSNAVLPSVDLVPIWPMRSRAAEYRDTTIRACVQAAAHPDCEQPVRYLRRAAELVLSTDPAVTSRLTTTSSSSNCSSGSLTPITATTASPGSARASCTGASQLGDVAAAVDTPAPSGAAEAAKAGSSPAGPAAAAAAAVQAAADSGSSGGARSGVPGLTQDFALYIMSHQGSQYDALLLKWFGSELLRAGCPDAASNVFYRLLLEAQPQEQAGYLQLCLDCWTSSSSGDDAGDASKQGSQENNPQQLQQQGKGGVLAPPGPASTAIINKLADFVQRQRCLSPRAIVQMLESTMAMQLCQVLLSRAASAAAAADPGSNASLGLGLPGGLGSVVDVMLELVSLGHQQLAQQVQQVSQQLHQLQQQQHVGSADSGGAAGEVQGGGKLGAAAAASSKQTGLRHSSKRPRPRWWRGVGGGKGIGRVMRVSAAATLTAAGLCSGNHPLLRLARVGPLLYLLRSAL